MAKKEVKTDLWVYELLKEAGIKLSAQGCEIKEIDEALKTASKSKTGNAGYPEYCGVVKDFILVIWLSNLDVEQDEEDASGSFSASITYQALDGSKLSANIYQG